MTKEEMEKQTTSLFEAIIRGLEKGELEAIIQAKCICVDARLVTKEEIGKKHVVWSHGKIEKETTLENETVLITTLGSDGKPVIDEAGHENTYDMPFGKFAKKYTMHENGHYVQDGTPMLTVKLPDELIPEEGITILPPNWGGYPGTLMSEGIVMFPFNPNLTIEENIQSLKEQGPMAVDWYPNNETQTYAPCDKNGIFEDETLRKTFNQKTTNKR